MIPPRQVHFYALGSGSSSNNGSSSTNSIGLRLGCFVSFEPEQVQLTRWSAFHERLFDSHDPQVYISVHISEWLTHE